jgi:protein TonB
MKKTLFSLMICASATLLFAEGEVRVSDVEARSHIASRVEPEYPVIARQMRVAGRVTIEAFVDTDGTVTNVEARSGNPLLTATTVKAVKRWKFSPFIKDGKAVKAIAPLNLDFRL